ncbi:MAG: metallophosphoesterase [Caldithrix sp.]|nr:MAG: metallophosphoesterase [Caldithrix sp.]
MEIGVISDTHGYINPKVFPIFEGVEQILHAGDIGSEDIITTLEAIAPVQAIHGNVDMFPLRARYPAVLTLDINGALICIIHDFFGLPDPRATGAVQKSGKKKLDLLIYGHSHEAKLERSGEVLLFNPGSAGKQRFSLRPAVGLLTVSEGGQLTPEICYLDN